MTYLDSVLVNAPHTYLISIATPLHTEARTRISMAYSSNHLIVKTLLSCLRRANSIPIRRIPPKHPALLA